MTKNQINNIVCKSDFQIEFEENMTKVVTLTKLRFGKKKLHPLPEN
jgi:hypothetical protein